MGGCLRSILTLATEIERHNLRNRCGDWSSGDTGKRSKQPARVSRSATPVLPIWRACTTCREFFQARQMEKRYYNNKAASADDFPKFVW